MALGSAFIAPLADRIGRRLQTLGCLLLVVVAMALSAATVDYAQLGICRLVTGLGIGGLVASLPVIAAEFPPQRQRSTMIALYTIGGVELTPSARKDRGMTHQAAWFDAPTRSN